MRDLTKWTWPELFSALETDVLARQASGIGHPESEGLWAEVRSRVQAIATKMLAAWPDLGGDDTAADVTQGLLIKLQAPELVTQLRQLTAPEGYIVVAIRNQIRSLGRRQRTEQRFAVEMGLLPSAGQEPGRSPDSAAATMEQVRRLRVELDRLPAFDRALLDQRFRQDLGLAAIAAHQRMSYSAVAVRLFRVLRKLKDALAKHP